jgi:hypothetical protein
LGAAPQSTLDESKPEMIMSGYFCRRLTRLTNAFSKKSENFEAAVALNLLTVISSRRTQPFA